MNEIKENAISLTRQFIQIPSESSNPVTTDPISPESGMVEERAFHPEQVVWDLQEHGLSGRRVSWKRRLEPGGFLGLPRGITTRLGNELERIFRPSARRASPGFIVVGNKPMASSALAR